MWDEWKLVVDFVVLASQDAVKPMQEDKKEEDEEADMEKGSSTTDMVPK